MRPNDGNGEDTRIDTAVRRRWTRRGALTALGTGATAALGVPAAADEHEATVWSESDWWFGGETWYAEAHGRRVYEGDDMLEAVQAAVDGLTPGRTAMETVVVEDGGTVGPVSDVHAVDLPSFTRLDVRGTITVEDTGEELVIPIRARSAESIEISNVTIEGNPRYGIWLQSCTDVHLGSIRMSLWETSDIGLGIRIDDGDGGRSRGVWLEHADIEGCAHHAVETYGVDGLDIERVVTRDTGGCGLLLNDTTGAHVRSVDATNPDVGGGYAGFRVANGAGPDVHVDEVVVRGGARGVFGVSNSHGFTVDHVDIEGTDSQGILIQNCQNANINGGTVRNANGEGVRIDSRDDGSHAPAEDVTIRDLRVVDDRANRQQTYGIRETGPGTRNNAILDNDLRNAGTVADLEVYAASTVTEGNVLTGDSGGGGGDDGSGDDGGWFDWF